MNRGRASPMDRIGARSMGPPKVSGNCGGQGMQPDIVSKQRNKSAEPIESGDQTHDGQKPVNNRDRFRIAPGSCWGTIGQNTPSTDGEMHNVMKDVDGEKSEKIPIRPINSKVRCVCRGHGPEGGKETEYTDSQKNDPYNKCKIFRLHRKSLSLRVKNHRGLFQFCARSGMRHYFPGTFPQVFRRDTV